MQNLQARRNGCSHLQLILSIHYLSSDLIFSWSAVITVVTTNVAFLDVITLQFDNHLPLYCRELLPHGALKKETIFISKMLVNSYQTAWCHILCDNKFNIVVMVTVNGYSSIQNTLACCFITKFRWAYFFGHSPHNPSGPHLALDSLLIICRRQYIKDPVCHIEQHEW